MEKYSKVPPQLRPYVFKKGNKLGGRKKGKSLKEYSRDYLASMTDEERNNFLNSLDPHLIWKMAEGNPHSSTDNKHEVDLPSSLIELLNKQ